MVDEIPDFYAVIPAGGVGSRLWPLSRADAPKFLHDLTGSGHSLLRDTWDRLAPLAGRQSQIQGHDQADDRNRNAQDPHLSLAAPTGARIVRSTSQPRRGPVKWTNAPG